MIITIDDDYRLTLTPENQCEKLALIEWQRRSSIPQEDNARMLSHHVHPRYIMLNVKETAVAQ